MSDKYNGWTNYETWLVNLWMDNDAGSYEFFRELADEQTGPENAAYELAKCLKTVHEDIIDESGIPESGFIADLLNAAMSEVNWYEIAEHVIEDMEE